MHLRSVVATLLFASVSLLSSSNASTHSEGSSSRKPWQWNDAERIASRTDAVAAADRVRADAAAAHAEPKGIQTSAAQPAQPFDVIDGKRNPELLLTQEVFDAMIRLAFADQAITRTAYRESKEQYRKELGLPSDFWERLGVISGPYIAERRREREVAFSNLPAPDRAAEAAQVSTLMCRDRFAAISEARASFGERFDQFLYLAIAPGISIAALRAPDAAIVQRVSGGCHD